ncbi:hypothetical protein ACIRQP_18155 [Streptomyces sp. NPDC102274]|uniref:hypothetical protein n=1 Tax=Streptomyces sp. NPDC102274 TaxID=3366151 RepID=UPI00382600A3
MDDEDVLVHTEKAPQAPRRPLMVQVHSPIGSAVVRWHGDPQEADGRHYIEWTVDEDIHCGQNTWPATLPEPGIRQEATRVVFRGRLRLIEDGATVLDLGDSQVLFDLGSPPPPASTAPGWRSMSKQTKSPCIPTCSDRSDSLGARSRSPVRGQPPPKGNEDAQQLL